MNQISNQNPDPPNYNYTHNNR